MANESTTLHTARRIDVGRLKISDVFQQNICARNPHIHANLPTPVHVYSNTRNSEEQLKHVSYLAAGRFPKYELIANNKCYFLAATNIFVLVIASLSKRFYFYTPAPTTTLTAACSYHEFSVVVRAYSRKNVYFIKMQILVLDGWIYRLKSSTFPGIISERK